MGAKWNGTWSGRHGVMGCYSCQTYKHVNSGEGGLLVCDDDEMMARAIMLSGSYMLFGKHLAGPPEAAYAQVKYETPNISGRMDHLRAAILRPQLARLGGQVEAWNARYTCVEAGLRGTLGLTVIARDPKESYVGSSIQFLLEGWSAEAVTDALARCAAHGVDLKWFGGAEPVAFTSRYDSWRYAPSEAMPATDEILRGIVDMRLPLTFSLEDCAQIARIIRAQVSAVYQAG
jgi:dTDP-4-amino-4,6-dideoxygalactose transaminase